MYGSSGQRNHIPIACSYLFFPFWPNTNLSGREQRFSQLKHSPHFVQSCSTEAVTLRSLIKPRAFCVLTVVTWAVPGIPLPGTPLWDVPSPSPGLRAAWESQLVGPATSKRQEVCVSIALLGNCPKHLGKRCLVLKNRCGFPLLGNIYVTCLKNEKKKKKRKKKTPRKEEERQGEHPAATRHVQCPQHSTAPGLGSTLTNCERHSSRLTDLPGEAAVVLILTSTTQICN